MKKENRKVLFAYLAVCFFWGSTYLAIRIGVKDFPPFVFASIRFLIAGSIMVIYSKLKKLEFPKDKKETVNISITGLFLLLGGNGLVVFAEQWVHSGIASLIIATVPLFMALIEYLIFKNQRLDYKGIIGLLLGFAGVFYLAFSNQSMGAINIKGIIMLLFASLFWATGSVYSKTYKSTSSIFSKIGIQMLAGGVGLLIVSISMGEIANLRMSIQTILALIYLIIFGSIVGYSSYIYVLQKWPASKAGTYAYVNPAVAVLLGAIILKESITVSIIFSMIIILFGVVLVQKSKLK